MSSVFVIISETMPVNGTYPASSIDGIHETEDAAWWRLNTLAYAANVGPLDDDDTVFYAEVDPEKYEYIEYRIEEHVVKTGENA